MSEAHATLGEPSRTPRRWTRPAVAETLASYGVRVPGRVSQRQFALDAEVPRTTLQDWLERKDARDTCGAVIACFESPEGLAVLHRILGAGPIVFTQVGPCGVDLVSFFLELSHLTRCVGSSHGAQPQVSPEEGRFPQEVTRCIIVVQWYSQYSGSCSLSQQCPPMALYGQDRSRPAACGIHACFSVRYGCCI